MPFIRHGMRINSSLFFECNEKKLSFKNGAYNTSLLDKYSLAASDNGFFQFEGITFLNEKIVDSVSGFSTNDDKCDDRLDFKNSFTYSRLMSAYSYPDIYSRNFIPDKDNPQLKQ